MLQRWSDVARHLLAGGLPLVAAAVQESSVISATSDTVTVLAPAQRLGLLADPEQQRQISHAIMAITGKRLKLVLRAGAATTSGTSTDAATSERRGIYAAAQQHPLVQEIIKRFDADLVGRELIELETWLHGLAAQRNAAPRKRFSGDVRHGMIDESPAQDP